MTEGVQVQGERTQGYESRMVSIPSGKVHYVEAGEGLPLILLHANPGDSRDFDAVIPDLAKHHRVISLDWPGYGQSPPPSDPDQVDVLSYYRLFVEFLDTVDLPQVSIIGNSLGGNIAARFAASHPERVARLVLVSPGGFTPQNAWTRFFCWFQGSRFSIPPYWFARLYLRVRTSVTDDMLSRAKSDQTSQVCLTINRSIWRSFGRPENELRGLVRSIRAAVFLIFGDQDPVISVKRDRVIAARSIPHAHVWTPSCGHAPFAELPDEFLRAIGNFLRRAS